MDKNLLLNQLVKRYPEMIRVRNSIDQAVEIIIKSYNAGGKLLICGNGGSSSDSDHLAGELMKSFEQERPLDTSFKKRLMEVAGNRGKYLAEKLEHGLPAISLSAHSALTTAISNDIHPDLVFAQQLIGYAMNNDILIAISTSGSSQNVVDACIAAKAMNLKVIGLTGRKGGRIKKYCDVLINVPEEKTADVQEAQLPVLHVICRIVEEHFYGPDKK